FFAARLDGDDSYRGVGCRTLEELSGAVDALRELLALHGAIGVLPFAGGLGLGHLGCGLARGKLYRTVEVELNEPLLHLERGVLRLAREVLDLHGARSAGLARRVVV